jgi:hypothetical protein
LTGWKEFAPAPNPMAVSAVAVPPTVIEAVPFVPVRTRLPVLPPLSAAETFRVLPVCAALMAEIRLATVSLPVEVYVKTELTPSLMVIWSPLLMPSDAKVALVEVLTPPVPDATASAVSFAPVPTIVAAGDAPASGFASKSLPFSIPDFGVLGRLS